MLNTKSLVFDCFMFYNEIKLLELKLRELESHVDYFVIVESNKTFTLKPKKLYFEENKKKFSCYKNKILHYVVDSLNKENPWENEFYQRNYISKILKDFGARKNDIIILEDADELCRAESVTKAKKILKKHDVIIIIQDMYYYNFETYVSKWKEGSRICKFDLLEKFNCNQIRNELKNLKENNKSVFLMENGGWHFSYFGNEEIILKKIESFSHQELTKKTNLEKIKRGIKLGIDLYNRNPNEICCECKSSNFIKIKKEDNKNLPENISLFKELDDIF
jgi:beta-1,4-mannosyl-glycoprotein beta-1,4-N-acetylglucosaminyltransferase